VAFERKNKRNFFALGKEVDLGKLLMMTFAYCSTFMAGKHSRLYFRDGIFKLLRIPGIDSKESIPPAWRAGVTTLFLLGS
jgi:hypothetical protein